MFHHQYKNRILHNYSELRLHNHRIKKYESYQICLKIIIVNHSKGFLHQKVKDQHQILFFITKSLNSLFYQVL